MNLPLIWILSGLLFAGLLISLGFQPKALNRLLGVIFLFVGLAGLCFYGYGYYTLEGGCALTVAKTVFWVFCMFLGRNDIGTLSKVPFLAQDWVQILLYLIHLFALYATASTFVTNVGARLIRSLNLILLNRRKISLIYGVHDGSLELASHLQQADKSVPVFIDDGAGSAFSSRILRMGGILLDDEAARQPSPALLKKIGLRPGRKKLALYCLSMNQAANLRYAQNMKEILSEAGIRPEHCSVTLLADEESAGAPLQAPPGGSGFGSVLAMDRKDLMARMLIREFPPCRTMRFREHGLADENFEVLLIGFGKTGQAVLRQLLMNGQFAGSRFHALIIARDYSRQAGHFMSRYAGLMDHYDLEFTEDDARSVSVYAYLKKYIHDLNYVVICTGSASENAELAQEYQAYLDENGGRARVVQCTQTSITSRSAADGMPRSVSVYSPDVLCGTRLDGLAMQINHQYHLSEGRTAEEDWASCDYFSRESCRASADYMEAFLCAAGLSNEDLAQNGWPDDPQLMENLGIMEHERWCAFHFCMGYRTMPDSVFEERAAAFRREKAETGSSRIRAGKDTVKKLHACLIPWEDLPALDRKEKEQTGRDVDYQQMDRDNVLLIPKLLA